MACPLKARPCYQYSAQSNSYHLHDNPVRWLLVTSHFADEKAGAQRKERVPGPSQWGAERWGTGSLVGSMAQKPSYQTTSQKTFVEQMTN